MIFKELFARKSNRLCPKCGGSMEYIKVKSNDKSIKKNNKFLQCVNCKSVLITS